MKDEFRAWCLRNGLKPVRSVTCESPVGSAALRMRKGRFTVEVARELDASQVQVINAGFTHGWEYPLLNASASRAVEFFAGTR